MHVPKPIKLLASLMNCLNQGFVAVKVELVEKMIIELNRIESETDDIQIKLRQGLFNIENELKPIDVIFLYKIIEWIGILADCAQQVGSRLRMLTVD